MIIIILIIISSIAISYFPYMLKQWNYCSTCLIQQILTEYITYANTDLRSWASTVNKTDKSHCLAEIYNLVEEGK